VIDLGLNGKRAVVSGAGYIPGRAGHGRWTSLRLGEAGATVACIDIDEGRGKGIVSEIKAAGGNAFPVVADMTNRAEVERALDEAVAELGGIDVCVDIIGKSNWDRAESFTDEGWDWAITNNLTHVFYLFAAAGRRMIAQGTGGAMVALASVDGITAAKFHAPYGAAKAGVISLAKSFADEFGHYGIRVNVVAPGNVGTGNEDQPDGEYDVNEINPLAAPRNFDIANAVLFLCSSLSQRITGHTIPVDGGAIIHDRWGLSSLRFSELEGLG
jgi:NAD(P)-dependent dehydrogenase (short-subunit alcohol dehydrogenase family)